MAEAAEGTTAENGNESGATGTTDAKPPWGDDANFDASRAWKLIEDTRSDREKFKADRDALAARVKEFEDATKSEADKAADRAAEIEQRATEAEKRALEAETALARAEVALEKGLTPAQAKRLTGSTKEELAADADEFLELLKDGNGGGEGPTQRPKEDLRSGAATSSGGESLTDILLRSTN